MAGASAYPRALDFEAFADIAHRHGLCGVVVGQMEVPVFVSLGGGWRDGQAKQAAEEKGKAMDSTHDAV